MHSRVLDVDPFTGAQSIHHFDPVTEVSTIQTVHDVEPILEANKGAAHQFDERSNWKGDMHRVASIPMSLYWELKKKGIADDPEALRRWLNDPDNQLFRTRPGRV